MPQISVFYGIVITMYFYDHEPPHSNWSRAKDGGAPEPIEPLP